MFFSKNKKIKNNFYFNTFISNKSKFCFWKIFFSGLFFDEIFSVFLKKLNKNYFSLPSIYFFDKYFSYWFSYNFLKKKLSWLSNYIFLEKTDRNIFVIYLILILFYFIITFFIFVYLY